MQQWIENWIENKQHKKGEELKAQQAVKYICKQNIFDTNNAPYPSMK